jgi:hypothetical protein
MTEGAVAVFRADPIRDQVAVVQAVAAAIAAARVEGRSRLLVDLRPTAGMAPPTLAQRDALVAIWARAAQGQVMVALLAQPEMLDPERFGEMMAAAAGFRAEGFSDPDLAMAWLLRQHDPLAPMTGSAASAPGRTPAREP